jgi:hypothetical protein
MRSVMERAMKNLTGCPVDFHGLNLERLVGALAQWLEAVDHGQPVPPLPRIKMTERP